MTDEQRAVNSARLKALWQTQGFLARVDQGREKARATRRARAEIKKAKRATELQARREVREQRQEQREEQHRLKREARDKRAAEKMARQDAPLPKIEISTNSLPNWMTLRNERVTVQENGQCVRRSWAELGETE